MGALAQSKVKGGREDPCGEILEEGCVFLPPGVLRVGMEPGVQQGRPGQGAATNEHHTTARYTG